MSDSQKTLEERQYKQYLQNKRPDPMELKPCPFCGSKQLEVCVSPTNKKKRYIRCANYLCFYGACVKKQDREFGWNSRPIEDALRTRIAELEAENERLKEQIVTWHKYPDEKPTELGRYVIHRRHNVMPRIDVRFWTGKDWRDRDDSVYDRDIAYWAYLPEPPHRREHD